MVSQKQVKKQTREALNGMFGHASDYRKVMAILAVLMIIVSGFTLWNTMELRRAMDARTQIYVGDVTLQLTDEIDFRLKKNVIDLEMLEDSLLHVDNITEESLHDFLDRKADLLGYTAIALIRSDGNIYTTQPIPGDLSSMSGIQASFSGENGVSFLNEQSILYSIPIMRDGKVAGVLAGMRNRENMQQLIRTESFSGRGLTCIIDPEGQVIISPTNVDPFMVLDDIFLEESNDETVENILQMRDDMKNHRSGVFTFTAVDGTSLVLAYNPLQNYNWVLLTLVPADIISAQTDLYLSQTFTIIAGTILLFFIILTVLFHTYRNHFRLMERLAFTDRLTGAMNNAAFQLQCRQLLDKSAPGKYTVVLLNIRNFKLINASYGSVRGDETLRHVMNVLLAHIQDGELAARADADNFFLCLKGCDPEEIRRRLQKMVDAVNSFDPAEDGPSYLTLQQGAYVVDEPHLDITIVQDRAKTACRGYSALPGSQCVFYDEAVTKRLQKEQTLNHLFDRSLADGDFKLFLQPKVRLHTGTVCGAEALVRWEHPQRGMIFPSDFIPLFEKNGRICQLDLYIFEETCKTIRRWIDEGKPLFPVSVNLSRQHFQSDSPLDSFYEIAQRYQIPSGTIEMELTESIFFDDQGIENVKAQIRRMHEMGFLCSLDDFGSGYSSLGLLMEFDVDVVKLDRRFFLHDSNPKARKVVASVIQLCRDIGTQVVAEGIETPQQLSFLEEMGCDMVQGYLYSKPLPVTEFEKWQKDFSSSPNRGIRV